MQNNSELDYDVFSHLSAPFMTFYILAGVTDMIDGTVARLTHKESEFGAGLDSFADIVFVICCIIKIIPEIRFTLWIIIGIGLIFIVRVVNIISGFAMQKKLVLKHTIMNNVTGFLLFVFPLTLRYINIKYTAPILIAVALFAAIQEGHFIRTETRNDNV